MMESHKLSGKIVTITKGTFKGEKFVIEDFTKNLFGTPWYNHTIENPAVLEATMRSMENEIPMSSDAVYGKIGGLGHIIHESEWEAQG